MNGTNKAQLIVDLSEVLGKHGFDTDIIKVREKLAGSQYAKEKRLKVKIKGVKHL